MITFFNKIGNSWIAKIICAALAISMMAFWGLGGLSSSFSGNDHKAVTVGSDVITIDQVNRQLDQERAQIAALTGQTISVQKAIEMGLLNHVIQQLVNERIQTNIANKIGLIASDEAVRKYVERNPLFQDSLGNFDTKLFNAYMGQLKINQAQLSEKLKQELVQQHLMNALSKTCSSNSQIINLIGDSQKEKRKVSAIFLAQKDVNVGSPDESTLKDYYEAYQEEFMNPEYRQIQLLSIQPKHFKGEKDQVYDKMYQVVQNLEDMLGEGIPLKEAVQKLNLPTPDVITVNISGQTKGTTSVDNRLNNNPILQEIFTLSEHEATSITDFQSGFMVAEVEKIIPISSKSYESVKDQVRTLWKTEQQKEKLPELVKKVMDQIVDTDSWGAYYPINETVEQTSAKHIPLELLSALYTQKIGYKNVQSYPVSEGTWIVVVNQVIKNTHPLSDQEKEAARKLYTSDLFGAVQKSYAQDLNVKINENAIKKFYSSYVKDEE